MSVTNFLQDVTRYMDASLALLQNSNVFISESNKKFQDFENIEGNLGSKVDFVLPTRYIASDTLTANFQATTQRFVTLEVDQAKNVAYAFTAQEQIFNTDDYIDQFGRSAIAELAAVIEEDVATLAETVPYRFFSNGVDQINTYQQLAQALAFFRDIGAVQTNTKGVIPLIAAPAIVASGLQEFASNRADETAMSWEIGNFSRCDWYTSNLLPLHVSGVTGQVNAPDIIFQSIDGTGTFMSVTVASVPNEPFAFRAGDSLQFKDNVPGKPNLRYLTQIGHSPSSSPVQIRLTTDGSTNGIGSCFFSFYPALIWDATNPNQNLSADYPLDTMAAVGLELIAYPSHRCGLIWSGNALFLGMPRLPDERPFDTVIRTDPDTGASLRYYYGSKFGENQRGSVNDVIWGKLLVPEYAMKLMFIEGGSTPPPPPPPPGDVFLVTDAGVQLLAENGDLFVSERA
jgi:hypothetical protein